MSDLTNRFSGDNKSRLVEAIAAQRIVQHDRELAQAFADRGELVEVEPGHSLITQGAWDDDLYLILVGEFDVVINGRRQATRGPGVHVGELINAGTAGARTATLIAVTQALVLKLPQKVVSEVAGGNVNFAYALLSVLKERLDERNAEIGKTNDIPRVFLISSSEGKNVVDLIVKSLDGPEIAVETWYDGTFGVSDYPISSLMDMIAACDFTIAVVRADDVVVSRKKKGNAPRDNVSLEYGISLGMLGRRRSILLVCASDNVKLPTDTAGLTTYRYQADSADSLRRSVRTACISAKEHILAEGVFTERRPA